MNENENQELGQAAVQVAGPKKEGLLKVGSILLIVFAVIYLAIALFSIGIYLLAKGFGNTGGLWYVFIAFIALISGVAQIIGVNAFTKGNSQGLFAPFVVSIVVFILSIYLPYIFFTDTGETALIELISSLIPAAVAALLIILCWAMLSKDKNKA